MVFKNFRLNISFRVIVITICISALAWCLVHELYLRSVYLGAAVLILVGELIWYVDRFNRDIKTFMQSLLQHDFTTHYQETGKGKSFDALYELMNRISGEFKKIGVEKEIQHRYLEMLVDHVQVGILSYDQGEKIHLANTALKRLLQRPILMQIEALGTIDEILVKSIRELKTGQTKLVKVRVGKELLQLSLHASEFKLEDQYFKLISMQNIINELDAREMEAWQKLIRVMTHEIMNSIAPITSLSATLHGLVKKHKKPGESETPVFDTLDEGLEAIKSRSEGLHYFTEAYRRLTRIPQPSFRKTNLGGLIQRVGLLLERELKEKKINLDIRISEIEILMDPELMEQVMINLIRNSIEALEGYAQPTIKIEGIPQANGKVLLRIADNGKGMTQETLENIFIPFFTTKKSGSGIGLALTKQILQLHHAEIKANSIPGSGTEFNVLL